jgi:hypothetical protein
MNQHELDQLLRKVPVPERTEQYWEEFPEAITRRIKNEDNHGTSQQATVPARWVWKLAWKLRYPATAAVLLLLLLLPWKRGATPDELQRLRLCYREVALLFPKQLEAVVLTAEGAQLQLSDRPNVPDSPPIFVRMCPPQNKGASPRCTTAVSFSGQKIQLAGREFEILANGRGEIFLLAKEGVLVPGQALVGGEKWRFETGWLEHAL